MPNDPQRELGKLAQLFIVLGIIYAGAAVLFASDEKYLYCVINLAASVTNVLIGFKIRQRVVG
jgi:hypothetical protein